MCLFVCKLFVEYFVVYMLLFVMLFGYCLLLRVSTRVSFFYFFAYRVDIRVFVCDWFVIICVCIIVFLFVVMNLIDWFVVFLMIVVLMIVVYVVTTTMTFRARACSRGFVWVVLFVCDVWLCWLCVMLRWRKIFVLCVCVCVLRDGGVVCFCVFECVCCCLCLDVVMVCGILLCVCEWCCVCDVMCGLNYCVVSVCDGGWFVGLVCWCGFLWIGLWWDVCGWMLSGMVWLLWCVCVMCDVDVGGDGCDGFVCCGWLMVGLGWNDVEMEVKIITRGVGGVGTRRRRTGRRGGGRVCDGFWSDVWCGLIERCVSYGIFEGVFVDVEECVRDVRGKRGESGARSRRIGTIAETASRGDWRLIDVECCVVFECR